MINLNEKCRDFTELDYSSIEVKLTDPNYKILVSNKPGVF